MVGTDGVRPPSVEVTPPIALLTAPSAAWTFGRRWASGSTFGSGTRRPPACPGPGAGAGVFDFFEALQVRRARASADAGHAAAVVCGPVSPGGAPPGSGTQPVGFDGSVSLTPGWLGPSQE